MNKFEFLATQLKGKIDVLTISETKIDKSFPKGNFLIEEFSTPYRLDRDSKGGGGAGAGGGHVICKKRYTL